MQDKKNKWLFLITLILIFASIYALNILYPMCGEDWGYSFVWGEKPDTGRLSGLWDILSSQYYHYNIWGGRCITHGIIQTLLYIGEGWHNLINAAAFMLFLYLIYRIINFNKETNYLLLILIFFGLWFALPDFTSNIAFISYSGNYLWGSLITISFLYQYYKYYQTQKNDRELPKSFLLFFCGIIAGWTNENIAVSVICFLVIFLFLLKKQNIRIPKWMYAGLAGFIIGAAILILAPGNYARAEMSLSDTESLSLMEIIGSKLSRMFEHWYRYMGVLTALYLIILYSFNKFADFNEKKRIRQISFLFFITAYFGFFIMVPLPEFSSRTLFGPVTFLIIAIGLLYINIPKRGIFNKKITYAVLGAISLTFCITGYSRFKYTLLLHDVWKQREIMLEEQKKEGNLDIVFPYTDVFKKTKKGFIIYEMSESTEDWVNTTYARYYEVHSVRMKGENE